MNEFEAVNECEAVNEFDPANSLDAVNVLDAVNEFEAVNALEAVNVLDAVNEFEAVNVSVGQGSHDSIVVPFTIFNSPNVLFLYVLSTITESVSIPEKAPDPIVGCVSP